MCEPATLWKKAKAKRLDSFFLDDCTFLFFRNTQQIIGIFETLLDPWKGHENSADFHVLGRLFRRTRLAVFCHHFIIAQSQAEACLANEAPRLRFETKLGPENVSIRRITASDGRRDVERMENPFFDNKTNSSVPHHSFFRRREPECLGKGQSR